MDDSNILLFLDALEDEDAIVVLGEQRFTLPRGILPMGSREGSWLRLSLHTDQDLEKKIEVQRERLLASDPGGDIKL